MTFALTLPEYERNLSTELSAFQQNGDLVDMTVAADGHLVRVHRLLLASVSPYLKELITSTTCTQPVLFLNNLSYSTLCSLLEYIYTGEVQVSVENITDVLNAGKALHIKGLEDMNVHQNNDITTLQNVKGNSYEDAFLNHQTRNVDYDNDDFVESSLGNELQSASDNEDGRNSSIQDPDLQLSAAESGVRAGRRPDKGLTTLRPAVPLGGQPAAPSMQYTLSNRGSLQMILNRYMYYVKYCSKRSGFRQWRCVDYIDHRCPATVVTKDDAVLKRIAVHNHPYHDKRILKKTQVGAVFSTLVEAEDEGQNKKKKTETIRQKQGKDREMET